MKTILLCAINARYSHSSLALLYLKRVAPGLPVDIAEYNINDSPAQVIEAIVDSEPGAVGFSCYIWNIEFVLKVASAVKKLRPECLILLGGPEVSYDTAELMKTHGFIDMTIKGPGEAAFAYFASAFSQGEDIGSTPSACIRQGGDIVETETVMPLPLSDIPFTYDDLSPYEHRIIYYETSRGCPFRCAYCLSAEAALDFLPVERALTELEYFMAQGVRQVKLVDRTFNYPDDRAREIFSALIALTEKYPDSRTNYHFEITAGILSEETFTVLAGAPKGLFQFEVGIQSTHGETLQAVNRSRNVSALLEKAGRLCRMDNLHVHVDLIAGLPHETEETFAVSFNDAYWLGADRLQLGFLKLLKGSPLRDRAAEYGIIYTDDAPYEVLQTGTMSYAVLRRLHRIETLLDMLYNDGVARRTLALLTEWLPPYTAFSRLTGHLEQQGYFARPQKTSALFEQLYLFISGLPDAEQNKLREALAFDWMCRQKGDCPALFAPAQAEEEKAFGRSFFTDADAVSRYLPGGGLNARQLERRCRIVFFQCLFDRPAAVLFDYSKAPDESGFWQIILPGGE